MNIRLFKTIANANKHNSAYMKPDEIYVEDFRMGYIKTSLLNCSYTSDMLPRQLMLSPIDSKTKYTPAKLLGLVVIETIYSNKSNIAVCYKSVIGDELYNALVEYIRFPNSESSYESCVSFINTHATLIINSYRKLIETNYIGNTDSPFLVEVISLAAPSRGVVVLGKQHSTSSCYDVWGDYSIDDLNIVYNNLDKNITPNNAILKYREFKTKCPISSLYKFVEMEYLMEVLKCILV